MRTDTRSAVVLVDPVSSGVGLKKSVVKTGRSVIAVFTMTQEQLTASGKHLPDSEKHQLCDEVIYEKDPLTVLRHLAALPYSIAGVIAASEPGVELADCIAARLGLLGNANAMSLARRDKFRMREAVKEKGLCSIPYAACYTADQAVEFAKLHGYPVVIKTPKGAGGNHVYPCHDSTSLEKAFASIVSEPNVFGEATDFALVESFIPGDQFAVETFGNGEDICVTSVWAQLRTSNSVTPSGRLVTSLQELAVLEDVTNYAIAVAAALEIKRGPALIEIRRHPRLGPVLVEAGARLAGLGTPFLVEASSDFSPFDATVEAFTEVKPTLPRVVFHKNAAVHFCSADGTGVVTEIRGTEKLKQLSSYFNHKLFAKVGEFITTAADMASVALLAHFVHESADQIANDIARLSQLFKVTVGEPRTESAHAMVAARTSTARAKYAKKLQ